MPHTFQHIPQLFPLPFIFAAGLVMFLELIFFGVFYVSGFEISRKEKLTGTPLHTVGEDSQNLYRCAVYRFIPG